MKWVSEIVDLLKQTFAEWNADQAPRLAAALAYYTAFALAPLLVIVIAIVGVIFSREAAQTQILHQIESSLGAGATELVSGLIESSTQPQAGILSALISIITLLLGAIGAFTQLQGALDIIWNVDSAKRETNMFTFLKDNLLSFGMILVIGFLLLVSLVLSVLITALNTFVAGVLPGTEFVLNFVNFFGSIAIITLLFALIFKFLPHTFIQWRSVWVGAVVTALLFVIGKQLLGLYLGRTSTTSAYGATGSLVVILLWVYYSAQIILFGAEFTQVYAKRYGQRASADQKHQLDDE
jgi:membrane protein